MAPLDLGTSGLTELPDLDPDAPTGPNLELDGDFSALERAALGSPEKQSGDKIIPAEEPLWKDVAVQAAALLERSYDLRVLTHLATARLHLGGLADFAAVLATIRQLLQTRWEQVHPQLDPEDDNDPTLRANALLQLAHPIRVLRALRDLPLASERAIGVITWRAINALINASEDAAPQHSESEIRGVFAHAGFAASSALRQAGVAAMGEIVAIGTAFDANSGFGSGPDLKELSKLLHEIVHYIDSYAPAEDVPAEDAPPGDAPPGDALGSLADASADEPGAVSPAARRGVSAASLTAVTTRADALRLLDIVCRYYEQNEPSSPLPLMIGRARRLADKSFLEILQDLAPDGISQAQAVVQSRET